MVEINPFANIPSDKEDDFRFLLERIYFALMAKLESNSNAVRGKIGEHEGKITTLESVLTGMEACPCGKRHDPGSKCPLFLLENEVMKSKWRNAGIYTGFFTAGALFYYLSQLVMAWMRV